MMPSKIRLVVGMGSLLAGLLATSGIALADPDPSAIINSTCTYPQVMAALRAQSPAVADQVTGDPIANIWLQQLVAAPPDQRRQMINQAQNWPAVQQDMSLIFQVAQTCNNF
jgi:hemophore-related protein